MQMRAFARNACAAHQADQLSAPSRTVGSPEALLVDVSQEVERDRNVQWATVSLQGTHVVKTFVDVAR